MLNWLNASRQLEPGFTHFILMVAHQCWKPMLFSVSFRSWWAHVENVLAYRSWNSIWKKIVNWHTSRTVSHSDICKDHQNDFSFIDFYLKWFRHCHPCLFLGITLNLIADNPAATSVNNCFKVKVCLPDHRH